MPARAPSKQEWEQLEQAIRNIVVQKANNLGVMDDDWIDWLATDVAESVSIILDRTGWGLRGAVEKEVS